MKDEAKSFANWIAILTMICPGYSDVVRAIVSPAGKNQLHIRWILFKVYPSPHFLEPLDRLAHASAASIAWYYNM